MKKANLQTKKKHRKRHKKGKRGRHDSHSSDDIPVAHKVDIIEEEMPEGAEVSDHEHEDKRSVDDPHRALNVDLERPLDEHDRLPVREHYEVGTGLKLSDGPAEEVQEKPKRKHRKGSEEKGKGKKEGKEKDKKKKKKKSHEKKESIPTEKPAEEEETAPTEEPNLMGEVEDEEIKENGVLEKEETVKEEVEDKVKESASVLASQDGSRKMDDISFWLTKDDVGSKEEETIKRNTNDTEETEEQTEQVSKKSKKEKKAKKEKKKDKKKKHHVKEEYEEVGNGEEPPPPPSEESAATNQEETPEIPPMPSYKLLAENPSIKMTYQTRIDSNQSHQVVVSVIFCNLTSSHLKSLEFNVLDSLNTKLVREIGATSHDGIKVPFQLPPGATNEGQFAFTVSSITMSQKLRGTLTYVVKDDEGSTSEKLDFKVHLPISAYMIATPCNSDQFARLLSGGELTGKASITAQLGGAEFPEVLARICFYAHLVIVERVENTVSLYGRSLQGHHICILMKAMPNGSLSVDGKGTDGSLISNLLDEIRLLASDST